MEVSFAGSHYWETILRERVIKLLRFSVLTLLLVGCIRPLEEGGTPTAEGTTIVPTPPTIVGNGTTTSPTTTSQDTGTLSNADRLAIQTYLQVETGKQVTPGTLVDWQVIPIGADSVVGFSYTNPSGLPCAGAVMVNRSGAQGLFVYNGEAQCATEPGARAVGGNWFFLTWHNNQPLRAVVGEIFSSALPVNVATIMFEDGRDMTSSMTGNRFLYIRTDSIVSATRVQFINEQGNIEQEVFMQP